MAISTWITDVSIDNPTRTELDRLARANERAANDPNRRIAVIETTRGIAAAGGYGKPGDDHFRPAQEQSERVRRYHEISYEGCVLETREQNGYDDSDFYAIVWDEASESVTHVTYATTRGWTYLNGASVDATDENQAKARKALAAKTLPLILSDEQGRQNEDAASIVRGDMVFVSNRRARKVEFGRSGSVVWVGTCRYTGKPRVGVLFNGDDEATFTAAKNLTKQGACCDIPNETDARDRADRWAANHWLPPIPRLGGMIVIH